MHTKPMKHNTNCAGTIVPINCEHVFYRVGTKKGRRDISGIFCAKFLSSKPPTPLTRYCAQELFSSTGCRRVILPSKLIPISLQILGVPKHSFSPIEEHQLLHVDIQITQKPNFRSYSQMCVFVFLTHC